MKLYLVQHGVAATKEQDPDRPLIEQGREDIMHLAVLLGGCGVRVEHIMHSGKTRACQTAQIYATQLAPEQEIQTRAGLNPNDPIEPFVHELGRWWEDTLIVGHLPFISKLVARLVTSSETTEIVSYCPGTVVCLERSQRGQWAIAWMIRPDLVGS